jgi:hypothetical protein
MSSDGGWLSPGTGGSSVDAGRLAVGGLVGLSGLLLLAQPVVDPVVLRGVRVPMVGLAPVALAAGLDLGAVVFYRRNRPAVATAHGAAGLGWTLVAVAPFLGSGPLLFVGLAVVVGGVLFLAAEFRN